MNEMQLFQEKQYTGTMESLEEMVKDLKLEPHNYHFNPINKRMYINPPGILYFPGDWYQYEIE
jgi:hypothetical protein